MKNLLSEIFKKKEEKPEILKIYTIQDFDIRVLQNKPSSCSHNILVCDSLIDLKKILEMNTHNEFNLFKSINIAGVDIYIVEFTNDYTFRGNLDIAYKTIIDDIFKSHSIVTYPHHINYMSNRNMTYSYITDDGKVCVSSIIKLVSNLRYRDFTTEEEFKFEAFCKNFNIL